MARPQKGQYLSLAISTQALEARLQRDPDQLDVQAFAAQFDNLFRRAVERNISKKELVDLLAVAHGNAGRDIQRAFIDSAVSATLALVQGKAAALHDKLSAGKLGLHSHVDDTMHADATSAESSKSAHDATIGAAGPENRSPDEKEITARSLETASSNGRLGPPVGETVGRARVLEKPGQERWHKPELMALEEAVLAKMGTETHSDHPSGDNEMARYGAVRRHFDGNLVFAKQYAAAKYERATGRTCYVEEPPGQVSNVNTNGPHE